MKRFTILILLGLLLYVPIEVQAGPICRGIRAIGRVVSAPVRRVRSNRRAVRASRYSRQPVRIVYVQRAAPAAPSCQGSVCPPYGAPAAPDAL